ncbi:MAG: hypothetical protein IT443_03085 [Phycisphaeraceae bacterium]|nr:hypothetical protein [Phycisphaeraceae bacterium]
MAATITKFILRILATLTAVWFSANAMLGFIHSWSKASPPRGVSTITFEVFSFALTAYLIYVAVILWVKFSPSAVRQFCAVLGVFLCFLSAYLIRLDSSDTAASESSANWRFHTYLIPIFVGCLTYELTTLFLNRLLFPQFRPVLFRRQISSPPETPDQVPAQESSPSTAATIVMFGLRTLATMAGVWGLLYIAISALMMLSVVFATPDNLFYGFIEFEIGLEGRLFFMLTWLFSLLLGVFMVYVAYLVRARFSPSILRQICGLIGFAVFCLALTYLGFPTIDPVSHDPDSRLLYIPIFAILAGYLTFKLSNYFLNRLLFPKSTSLPQPPPISAPT